MKIGNIIIIGGCLILLCSCSYDSQGSVTAGREVGNMNETIKQDERRSYVSDRLTEAQSMLVGNLEKKYDDTFVITETGLKGILEKYDYVVAHSETRSEDQFNAYVMDDGHMEDEYYGVLKKEETGNYVAAALEPVLGPCIVTAKMYRTFNDDFTSDVPIESAVKKIQDGGEGLRITANIFIMNDESQEVLDEKAQKAKEALISKKIDGSFAVYRIITAVDGQMSWDQLDELKKNKENYDWKSVFTVQVN